MRFALILITFVGFVALCWHAVFKGTETRHLRGAVQISESVRADAQASLIGVNAVEINVIVDGRNAHLTGSAASEEMRQQAISAAQTVPLMANLTHDIVVAASNDQAVAEPTASAEGSETAPQQAPDQVADPVASTGGDTAVATTVVADQAPPPVVGDEAYYLLVWKEADGTVMINGNVPDKRTRETLLAAAEAISDLPLIEQVTESRDFPSTDWLDLNRRGIDALSTLQKGELSVVGEAVTLRGNVETRDEYDRLATLTAPNWNTEITVLRNEPDAEIALMVAADGSITGSGRLPEGMTPLEIATMLPGLSAAAFESEGYGFPIDWTAPMEGLNIVLPRLDSAQVHLKHDRLSLTGTLKDGYSIDGLQASLQSAMPEGWELDLDISAPPPLSELLLNKTDGVIGLSGVLPRGLPPEDAIAAFGDMAGASGLTEGGTGDAADWRALLGETAQTLDLFSDVTGTVSDKRIAVAGTLKAGYDAESVRDWHARQSSLQGWEFEIEAETTQPQEGDVRRVLNDTNAPEESFTSGFWLPVMSFAPSVDTCGNEIEALLKDDKVRFITSSARFEPGGKAILDRLAAVILRCADLSDIRLEIGGHTDSVGNDAANLRLSEKRANVVLDELVSRGIRADVMAAVGYGESEPIASNNTSDGRAQNRRITFGWSTGDKK